jgi:hypothetical protein
MRDVGLSLREAEDEDARWVEEVEERLRVLGSPPPIVRLPVTIVGSQRYATPRLSSA